MDELWPALWLSLKVAVVATVGMTLAAVPLAYVMARRRFAGQSAIETLMTLPLVLPPTVVGYGLLLVMGRHGAVGYWLNRWFSYSVMFQWHGAVLAAAVVAFPLVYLPAKAAFAAIDTDLEDVSRLMGANSFQVFWHVSLPLARLGIGSGLLLGFARALGEFGATIMVLGAQTGRQTLPILIYDGSLGETSEPQVLAAIAMLLAVSLGVLVIYNYIAQRTEN